MSLDQQMTGEREGETTQASPTPNSPSLTREVRSLFEERKSREEPWSPHSGPKSEAPGTGVYDYSRRLLERPAVSSALLTPGKPDRQRRGSELSSNSWVEQGSDEDTISICPVTERGYHSAEARYKCTSSEMYTRGSDTDDCHAQSDFMSTLEGKIRGSQVSHGCEEQKGCASTWEAERWLPFDKLFGIVNEEVVYTALSEVFASGKSKRPTISDFDIHVYAKKICGTVTADSSCRGIFAVLVMLHLVEDIIAFVDAGVNDLDLPLECHRPDPELGRSKSAFRLPTKASSLVLHWSEKDFDSFLSRQKLMISPYFNIQQGKIPYYRLHSKTVLPFIGYDKEPHKGSLVGRHGCISRVRIHPAHHNYEPHWKEEKNPYFAVKKLHPHRKSPPAAEVLATAKAGGTDGHDHLIKLLATWQIYGEWYLLLPWSDNNLYSYWEKHTAGRKDLSMVRWISKQCLGMLEGLEKIHRTHQSDCDRPEDLSGIHGDIKPANILHFDHPKNDHGILVVCDYGFTRFHSPESRSYAIPAGYSGTYRAPEYETHATISRACDLWSIGCVYLEFITWYFTGFAGFDKFPNLRSEETKMNLVPTDEYFIVYLTVDRQRQAKLKRSVSDWILELRCHPDCSQYFHDFLDLIERKFLNVDTEVRKNSDPHSSLQMMSDKCHNDQEGKAYCIEGKPSSLDTDNSPSNDTSVAFYKGNKMLGTQKLASDTESEILFFGLGDKKQHDTTLEETPRGPMTSQLMIPDITVGASSSSISSSTMIAGQSLDGELEETPTQTAGRGPESADDPPPQPHEPTQLLLAGNRQQERSNTGESSSTKGWTQASNEEVPLLPGPVTQKPKQLRVWKVWMSWLYRGWKEFSKRTHVIKRCFNWRRNTVHDIT